MATTKIWPVKTRLDHVLRYVEDKMKTENVDWSKIGDPSLRDVMDYAMDDAKTQQQYYVSGWNCLPGIALKEMRLVKRMFGKEDGILAFHGYQSFKPGEVSPEIAHEIGMKLAEELWPDHQVIIATHVNKDHVHNHFVLNSVGLHGRKFNACKASYREMRAASDRLCREYGLSVIEPKSTNTTKHYTEWAAEHAGEPTYRSIIRQDIDTAVKYSMTVQEFFKAMKKKGYVFEQRGSFLRIKASGSKRFMRLRSLGPGYSEESIKQRILRHRYPEIEPREPQKPKKYVRIQGDFRLSKVTWKGLRALYFFYVRKLREAKNHPKQRYPFVLKEDLRHLDALSEQTKFLFRYKLDTGEQVQALQKTLSDKLSNLQSERKELHNERRRTGTTEERKTEIEDRLKALSETGKQLRRDLKLCADVLLRSVEIEEKRRTMQQERLAQKPTEKGKSRNVRRRDYER
jgi:hypothetical protein